MGERGRPKIKLTDTQLEQIEKMAGYGLNMTQIAALLGMSKDTIERRANEDPAISAAIEKGRAEAIHKVAESAYKQAVSGACPAMTMFYLKCRAKWKETQVMEHTGADGEALGPQVIVIPSNGRDKKD